MKRKKGFLLLVFLGAAITIGTGVGITLWNKAPDKVESKKGLAITAAELCADYSQNEAAANDKYLNKTLEVTGTVTEVTKNQDGNPVLILQGDDMSVQCSMREKNVQASAGQTVTVKGFCSGSTMFDVLLTGCIML